MKSRNEEPKDDRLTESVTGPKHLHTLKSWLASELRWFANQFSGSRWEKINVSANILQFVELFISLSGLWK